jgi:hypothetical protein
MLERAHGTPLEYMLELTGVENGGSHNDIRHQQRYTVNSIIISRSAPIPPCGKPTLAMPEKTGIDVPH